MKPQTLLTFITIVLTSCNLFATLPAEIPVETLFGTPTLSSLQFSPNGKYIVALMPWGGRQNIILMDLDKQAKTLLTHFKDKDALDPRWANNDRIVFWVDDGGREAYSLYAVDRTGANPTVLASGGIQGENDVVNPEFRNLVSELPDDPDNMLVLAGITIRDRRDVAKMNLKTGKLTLITPAPGDSSSYVFDRNKQARIAIIANGPGKSKILYRDAGVKSWSEIGGMQDGMSSWVPVAFDGDNTTLYVASDIGRKTKAIYRYDTKTCHMGEMIFGDPVYNVESVVYDNYKKKVVGVAYDAERKRFHWIDPEMIALAKKMEDALPDTVHEPVQFSREGSFIVFHSYSDRDPGVYYLYDRSKGKISELGVMQPTIEPNNMARVTPVNYQARDGLMIHGYLTLPVGATAKNLPLVVHPHGGPYGIRDTWQYDPEVQFYANRGFAVMQVNYRGSGGYGDWFEQAGFKKWGLEMQNDLTDAVKWAISEGVADPRRVVIAGASYGGYATMAGLVYTPELYCAGINYVGVVNISDLIPREVGSAKDLYWYNTRIGDIDSMSDRKRIYDTSPVHFAERIRAPLLMAYGKNDPRVKITHAYDIEHALKKAGRPYEMVIESDEGHGFHNEAKRIAFFKKIDAFLKKYIPAGVKAP